MRLLTIARLFARRAGGDAATVVLPATAFAVVTLCTTVVAGGVSAFFTFGGETAVTYRMLALLALVLLVVPLASLGGAAARLAARRRDERLSSLRLLGASSGLVSALTVLESTAIALLGAVVGAVVSLVALPLFGLLHFDGRALGGAIWPPVWVFFAVIGAVGLLSAVSAAVGLRGVLLTPLGVRTRAVSAQAKWIRALVAVGVLVAAVAVSSSLNALASIGGLVLVIAVLLGGFAAVLAVLGLVGPFVLRLFAQRWLKRANSPARLIAARTVLDDTKAAWRQVGALSMVSFVGVFTGIGVAFTQTIGNEDAATRLLAADIRTGVVLTLAMSFAMVACAIGVNQAAGILDRRALYVSLDRIGMPAAVMDAARRRAVLAPLLVVTIGSAVAAALVLFPLTGYTLLLQPLGLAIVAGCLALGIGLVWAGLAATRPVLRRVLAMGILDAV
ncbi:FtsX-like permease family protein [Gryllotalpicola protaetiae]|uniref:Permease n=1 Tax=Gryllotalpicola protaetiae TaxID=2419771 RepID=A0A387BR35_9MICO|nr:FtsX-like permease family protein [Gryllotalpicola protaetiae]AYG05148.1 permease [Gryllotalpicola protaetiae]